MASSLPAVTNERSLGERLNALVSDVVKFAIKVWDRFERLVGRAPPVQGFVDALFQGEVIVGWVRDPDRPDRRLEVAAFQGEKVLGNAIADLPRKDLVAASYGDGRYGFRLRLTDTPDPTAGRIIRVCAITEKGRFALQRGIIALPEGSGHSNVTLEGPPIFIGVLERVDGSTLFGWAYNPDHPESPATVDIYDDERYLGSAAADRSRPKLIQQGLSTSARGFSFDLGHEPDADMLQRMRARVAGTAFELTKSRNFFEPSTKAGVVKAEVAKSLEPNYRREPPREAQQSFQDALSGDEEREVSEDHAIEAPARERDSFSTIGRAYAGKPTGLLLISGNAPPQDTAASVISWFGQSTGATVAVIAGDVRREISQLLPENRRDTVRWLDKAQKSGLRDFLTENEFVVLARAGDAFNLDIAFTLPHLSDLPDVVVWNDGVQSGGEARFSTYLLRTPIDGFAVRASVLSQYPGALVSEAQQGRLLPLRLWLAGQVDLTWSSIERPLERRARFSPVVIDEAMRTSCALALAKQPWSIRAENQDGAPTLTPCATPERISLALWRGWGESELKILADPVFELKFPVQVLIPTGRDQAVAEERRAIVDRIALRSGARQIYTKLVDCSDEPVECTTALLGAADADVVLFGDAQLDLANTNLAELFAWSLCDRAGVVTTSLETAAGRVANAAILDREELRTDLEQDGEGRLVDVVFGSLAVVSRHKAIAAGGFDKTRYAGDFQWLDFCLRLKQAGYYSISLSHMAAGLAEPTQRVSVLPLAVKTLLRSSHLFGC